jgi:hypothetical protein
VSRAEYPSDALQAKEVDFWIAGAKWLGIRRIIGF